MTGIDKLVIGLPGVQLTTNDATVAAGETLIVDESSIAAFGITFNGSAETDGHFSFISGAGGDVLTGGAQADVFDLTLGGNDVATGGGGDDTFNMGAAFTADDTLDGGGGTSNTVNLDGDYSGANAVSVGPDTLIGIQRLVVSAGHDYELTANDGILGVGDTLLVDASALGAADTLTFDGSGEADGGVFNLVGGAGNDVLTGGAADDFFNLSNGGDDATNGGDGNDDFSMGAAFTAADTIDGGAGAYDSIELDGDYTGGNAVVLGSATLINTEFMAFDSGHSYDITTDNATVAAAAILGVNGKSLGAADTLTFDGSAETDGTFSFTGGAGNNDLTGGALADTFDLTLGGIDTVHGGGGDDIIDMGATFTAADTIDGGTGFSTLRLDGHYVATARWCSARPR